MLKRIKERNIHFLILAFLIGLFFGITFSFTATANEPAHKYLDYFHQVYQLISTEYVDEPSTKNIFYGAIRGMIKALDDPFSRFLDEDSYNELKEMTTGKFVGVGIEITVRDEEIVVITPIADSPAMKAGIMAGDIIARVNNTPIKGMKLPEIVKLIKGLPGSKVKLYIKREGSDDLYEYEVERMPIKIKSVEYTILKESSIGYLQIKNFGSDTTKDVIKAIKYFNSNNIGKLIIDLRYNPGGLLDASIKISDLFLNKGEIIVSTRGRKGTPSIREFKAESGPIYNGELLILVNKGSASASEILAGAIRDNKRGKLLGEKTFGKGSVQKSFNLDENVGIAITVAKYYTPSGESIHKKGIKPDYEVFFEKISENDQRNIRIIEKNKLIDKFIKKNMNYNEETKKQFQDFLTNNKISLSSKTANFILKNSLNRFIKGPIYDLEFDAQLAAAVKIFNNEK